MPFHWQSQVNPSNVGVEDMVLLQQISDEAIVENLRKRLTGRSMFTYIGEVLISVNPFVDLPYFTEKEIELYRYAAQYENPPHIYAIADKMYRNLLIDLENQCVIISGESGAGKTVSAKLIMNYIARITAGGNDRVKHIKECVLKSNPLLEAFGNSVTTRNWNSSRFGKYVEIMFDRGGTIVGGRISNFLLEKSRVVSVAQNERNFHIFHQLIAGADTATKRNLGISSADYYNYLSNANQKTEAIDDVREFDETLNAMKVVAIDDTTQLQILQLVSAVLHIGNITFVEKDNFACISNDEFLQFPAYLLGLSQDAIKEKLTTRKMSSKWGRNSEEINVFLNVEQAAYTRDAWAKALYARMFDFLVTSVNKAMGSKIDDEKLLSIGILDIYGFEIFERNGFEQFCINFVNEKLQQIFIELTLKAEQEDYVAEGIKWTPIDYFNNKIVCDLIEAKKPPGVMPLLDDICAQIHGQSDGVDEKFLVKLNQQVAQNDHFRGGAECFIVKHYAGEVMYQVDGFCDRNRDILYADLIQLTQSSSITFICQLFQEDVVPSGAKTKPTSASLKIRTQTNRLVESLMRCVPHYIRCIKPNERKRPLDFEFQRVLHQVHYLGLRENIRIRRAGFAYRRPFDKFIGRYAILSAKTWPLRNATSLPPTRACEYICQHAQLSDDQFQLGRTKIFIKNPESLFLLEEARERKFDGYARVLQRAFRRFTAHKRYRAQKKMAQDLLYGKKERRRFSLNRNFVGDYIGLENRPALQSIVGKRERIEFANTVKKYDRSFKTKRVDLLLTSKAIFLIGKQRLTKGLDKGKLVDSLARRIPLENIKGIDLSPYQDDLFVVHVLNEHSNLLETPLKTEFLTALCKLYKEKTGDRFPLEFKSTISVHLKKVTLFPTLIDFSIQLEDREVQFIRLPVACTPVVSMKAVHGRVAEVSVSPGIPSNSTLTTFNDHGTQQIGRVTQRQHPLNGVQQKANMLLRTTALPSGFVKKNNDLHKQNQIHPVRKAPAPMPKPKAQQKYDGPTVKALYPYDAQDTDELAFQKDQIIELLQKDDSGWWQGRMGQKVGLFPANYVQIL